MSVELRLPEFPNWDNLEEIDYSGSFWDDQDINSLNATLIKTALNLKAVNKEITKYERRKTQTEIIFKRKFREVVINSSAKTEAQKKLMAEIECQEEEWKLAYLDEILRELNRISMSLRVDLDTLKTLGHNLRQEMRL